MNFCQEHWTALREAIEERGLGDLIAPDGETAALQMADQLNRGARGEEVLTPVNYAMNVIRQAGGNPLYSLMGGDEDPVDLPGGEGRTWPRCPLCYLNLAHELTCADPGCALDRERGYDWMIGRAADDQIALADEHRKGSAS